MCMRTSEFCSCLVLLGDHYSHRCHGSRKLMLPDIPFTEHWPFRPFKSTVFTNGPIKGIASACRGLGCASLHLHGFYEVVAMAAPSQLSWTWKQGCGPLTCTPAFTQSPPLPSFSQAPGLALEQSISASEKQK